MPASLGTISNQTLLITARHAGQWLIVGNTSYIAPADGAEIRVYGTGNVTVGPGWWDKHGVYDGVYDGPYFDGSYSPDPDMTPRWLGSVNGSASVLEGKAVTGVGQNETAHVIQSSWVPEGQTGHSVRVIPKSATGNAYAVFYTAGVASAATASAVVRLTAPQTGTISSPSAARGIYWSGAPSPRVQALNEPGETTLTLVHPNRTGSLTLHNGARLGGGDVWFYLPTVVNGAHPDLQPFSGATDPFRFRRQRVTPAWTGATDNSTSYFKLTPQWDSLLQWNKSGERLYTTGVDRGVLYLGGEGVVWNGITSVNEEPVGGEGKAYYMDGIKRFIVPSSEEFEATIEAYSSPEQFAVCDGRQSIVPGFSAGHQRREPFSFTYRTLLGNDLWQEEYGYEIHLVYNALAKASSKSRATRGDSESPVVMSWPIKAVPLRGYSATPTAHFTINSTQVNAQRLSVLESILYGYDNEAPRLPLPDEVADILNG